MVKTLVQCGFHTLNAVQRVAIILLSHVHAKTHI